MATEKHQVGGYHFHVAVKNSNASKKTTVAKIRSSFPEFDGAQCDVKFFKGWAALLVYVMKEDSQPIIWGEYSKECITKIVNLSKRKKKEPILYPRFLKRDGPNLRRCFQKKKKVARWKSKLSSFIEEIPTLLLKVTIGFVMIKILDLLYWKTGGVPHLIESFIYFINKLPDVFQPSNPVPSVEESEPLSKWVAGGIIACYLVTLAIALWGGKKTLSCRFLLSFLF